MRTISRRTFGRLAFGAALAALSLTTAADNDPDRLPLYVPLTHSDWMLKPGIAPGPQGVRHMLDACKACGWSHVLWRCLDGGRSLYPSKILRPMGKWDDDSFWSPRDPADVALVQRFTPGVTDARRAEVLAKCAALDYANFDPLAEAVRYGHQIGLQIHAWVSINEDDHGWGLTSDFAKAHPQFRWRRRDGRPYRSQLSFAFPEVRQYKLSIVQEILNGYDVDGLFLDWIRTGDVRDNPQTDTDGVANSGYEPPLTEAFTSQYGASPTDVANGDDRWVKLRCGPQTQFMRSARDLCRQRASARARPLSIAVLVGHPWHYRGLQDPIDGNRRGLLLDVTAWATDGLIDAAVAAGYYRAGGDARTAYRALRAEVANHPVDVWTYAWVPSQPAQFETDFSLAREVGARAILLWEADYIDDRANAAELRAAMLRHAR